MIRLATAATLALLALAPAGALGAEEPEKYALQTPEVGLSTTQAGAHPDFTTTLALALNEAHQPYANTKEVTVSLPAGLFGNPKAFPSCTPAQLGTTAISSECPLDSQIGSTDISVVGFTSGTFENEPIYNMPAPGGDIVARFGFIAATEPALINVRLDSQTDALVASVEGLNAKVILTEAATTFWGVPASPAHDEERLTPLEAFNHTGPTGGRPSSLPETPFMTNPTSCGSPGEVTVSARSYQRPDLVSTKSAPFPQISGCGSLEYNPTTTLAPTTAQGTSGSGLQYELDLPAKGLEFPNLLFGSESKRAEVILPKGMSVNPSEAEGLGVCSEEDLARETYDSAPNQGCPESSKVGTVEAISPVIDKKALGSLYLAKPYENPFDSLIALYMVLKIPDRGVLVKLAGKVSTDPQSGQITTVFDDIPQLPVTEFHLHFKEGSRAPLITPPACGPYTATSNFNPWAAPGKLTTRANSFQIESGPDHGPCPSGGLPPFHPGLLAYPTNLAAGRFTDFYLKLTRTDSEQEITHFSIKLPPGIAAKLAGVPFCPEAGIAAARSREGRPHGGEEELASPSCPAASQIGTTLAGSGVGGTLVYVPGSVYLAGPYHGAPISIVAITAAKAGPFDLGTVVLREALRVNPETAEVFIDATGSDPIPHIIDGIPVHLREIRAFVDRPSFTLNPTSCAPTSTSSTVLGAGLDFVSEADDNPFVSSSPFQVADCAALPFKPKLSFQLKGSTKRGGNPALHAHLAMKGLGPTGTNEAGVAYTQVALPNTEFLDNAHINGPCTRVQFKEGAVEGEKCPPTSIIGHAKAVTPILSEPLEGPVYLRSNPERNLPDIAADLHGQEISVVLVGHTDSAPGGGLRNTFEVVPDAPVTSFDLSLFGGHKGLLENAPKGSANTICGSGLKASVKFKAHNGKLSDYRAPLRAAGCGGKKKGKRHRRRRTTHPR